MTRLIESLESRRLMADTFSASINFAPISARRAPGLLADYGAVYGVRRGGLSYGWTANAMADAVERDLTPVQKNDTFIAMQPTTTDNVGTVTANNSWEIGVPDGTYSVYVVAGDPGAFGDRMAITVEGQVAVSGVTKSKRRYLEGQATVQVTDGRLTVGNADYAVSDKICYLAIAAVDPATLPTLAVRASGPTVDEAGTGVGRFVVSRSGDLADIVTVPLKVSGTATNGVDYGAIGRAITFAAGVDAITLKVRSIPDTAVEGDETVTLRLGAVSGYVSAGETARVTIVDDDAALTPAPTSVAWFTKAARPVAASEMFGNAVGGTLYTFGGFVDTTYHPTKAVYAYDLTSNTWTKKRDLPVGMTNAATVADGNSIYIAGGYPGTGANGGQTFSTTNVYRYDVASDTYSSLPGLPAARGVASMARVGRVLYFVGGADSQRRDVSSVYALDLDDTAAGWVTKASLPAARNHLEAIALNGYVYAIAGQTSYDTNLVTHPEVYRYTPASNTWTAVASVPSRRSHVTATAIVGGHIVVVAGQSADRTPISSVLQYDPAADQWSSLASLPSARFSGLGDLVDGKFVYAAGFNGVFKNTTYVGTFA